MSCDGRARPGGAGAVRVGDRHRLGAGGERAVGDDAGIVGGGDDRADGLGAELRARVGGRRRCTRAATSRISVGPGRPPQSSSSSTTRAIAAAFSASRRRPSASVRPDDATPTRLPMTTRRLIVTLVSATFWWISLLAKRVRAESSAMTSASASVTPSRERVGEGGLGQAQRVLGSVVVHRPLPVPTTCRPRPGRRGSARPARRGRRGRSGPARPCRSSACPSIT